MVIGESGLQGAIINSGKCIAQEIYEIIILLSTNLKVVDSIFTFLLNSKNTKALSRLIFLNRLNLS